MIKLFLKYFLTVLLATTVGFIGMHYLLYNNLPWSRTTNLKLEVSIRGTSNQAVADARLFLYMPTKKFLGTTDKAGEFKGEATISRNKVIVLEAQGPTFTIKKDIFIPRVKAYNAKVVLNPKEAELGHMVLISKAIEDMSKRIALDAQTTPKAIHTAAPVPTSYPQEEKIITPDELPADYLQIQTIENQDHNIPEQELLLSGLKAISDLKKKLFFRTNIKKLGVRSLITPEPFFEILALNSENKILSSVLLRASALKNQSIENATASLLKTNPSYALTNGTLFVVSKQPDSTRAYLNGISLPRELTANGAKFSLIKLSPNATHVALAITANSRPLIRKIIPKEQTYEQLEWIMPDPAFSMR